MSLSFVLTTFGSLGDLHPHMALAIGLRSRGHRVRIVTTEYFRAKIEAEGLEFCPSRPDFRPIFDDGEIWRKAFDERTGTEYIVRVLIAPHVSDMYDDLLDASRGADVIVGHPIALAAPLVAEKLRIPWVSVALAPSSMLSSIDPPVLAPAPWFHRLHKLGAWPHHFLYAVARRHSRKWVAPVYDARRRAGLNTKVANPIIEGSISPHKHLALFSPVFSAPQKDWAANTTQCGFVYYDREDPNVRIDPALADFINGGEPPVVFTLGSSAVFDSGRFYHESVDAIERLGRRAVLLVGTDARFSAQITPSKNVFVAGYAPHSQLMPHAGAIVHQGGIGTTAQALRSGKPMLVVPFAHDQPDNAMRAVRLGVARTIRRKSYRADRAAKALDALLNDSSFSTNAQAVSAALAREDGVGVACDALEAVVR